jgi:DNA-directed RNA polymerase subunit beta'
MAVHVPLSAEAQAEARILMLSSNNILKPADGRPVTMPTQDMITGIYHLTDAVDGGGIGAGRAFTSPSEARMAFDRGELEIGSAIKLRLTDAVPPAGFELPEGVEAGEDGIVPSITLETTLGRAIFNDTLPLDYPFENRPVDRKRLSAIVNDLAERYSKVQVAASLDALKEAGFHWSTRSGCTVAISDVTTPDNKTAILEGYETKAAKVQTQYERGLITDDERRQELV